MEGGENSSNRNKELSKKKKKPVVRRKEREEEEEAQKNRSRKMPSPPSSSPSSPHSERPPPAPPSHRLHPKLGFFCVEEGEEGLLFPCRPPPLPSFLPKPFFLRLPSFLVRRRPPVPLLSPIGSPLRPCPGADEATPFRLETSLAAADGRSTPMPRGGGIYPERPPLPTKAPRQWALSLLLRQKLR